MSIPVIAGRAPGREDGAQARRIVVVNRAFADRFWPGKAALGRRIDQGDGWAEVVGVVDNARMDSLNEPIRPLAFVPLAQTSLTALTLHVATVTPGAVSIDALRQTTATVHPDLPLLDPGTLADHIGAATFIQAVGARTLALMGAIAMFLAATGLYGLLAALVEQRRRDLAVRIALGASTHDIASSVAGPAFRSTALGIAIGTVAAVVAARLLQGQMPGTSSDPSLAVPIMAAALLLIVGAAVCIGPIMRARRIDPYHVLKQ
jgi:putative ABC transport system permease protein